MAKARRSAPKRSKSTSAKKSKAKTKKEKAPDAQIEGEVKVTKKRYGEVIGGHSDQGIFDCPASVHGLTVEQLSEHVFKVVYRQRFSKDLGGMWATIEFGLDAPCAGTHIAKTKQWIKRAVGETVDEEYAFLTGEADEEEETEW